MKILVTGAAGFIGTNLIKSLLKKKHDVIGFDKDESRKHLLPSVSLKFVMFWDDIKYLDSYIDDERFENIDMIYHLAAAADIARSAKNTTYDLVENVLGTHKVLEFMRNKKISKLMFASTSIVYGENPPKPTEELIGNFRPTSQYAASKIASEAFIHAYSNIYGINAWIYRFGNVIGKNERRGIIVDFITKLKENPNELEILGDGNQVKSYFHVSDCINAITYIHNMNPSTLDEKVETYNLATYDYKSVTEVANIVCSELKLKPKYKYTGGIRGWQGDVPKVMLSINKALSTGWQPVMKCEEAIRRSVRELSKM